MFQLIFDAYMLNDTKVIIQLISHTWIIIYLENRLNLNISSGVHFNAKRLSGFHFRQVKLMNSLAEWIRQSHAL